MTEDLREHLARAPQYVSASAELDDGEECPSTRLSRYENRPVKCHIKGPHDRCEGLDFGELRRW